MKDAPLHIGLRKRLIKTIAKKGINNKKVLEAMSKVPRHFFLDKAFDQQAYEDKAFPIGNKQTISQPFTVAYQSSLLEIEKRDKVLEIGTGSGYQAVVLAELGARVFSIERQRDLFNNTRQLLRIMGYERIKLFLSDGHKGLPSFAPFDKILITAATKNVPSELLSQLRVGGYLVAPVGDSSVQQMIKITKLDFDHFKTERFEKFRFVPLLDGIN